NLIKKADENANAAVKYSGLLGKGIGTTEKLAEVFGGSGDPDYEKYIKFTRVDVPAIAGEIMRELGANATDAQKKMYLDLVNPVSWDQNPKLALARWNHFKELSREVGRTVSMSPSEIQGNFKKPSTTVTKWIVKNG